MEQDKSIPETSETNQYKQALSLIGNYWKRKWIEDGNLQEIEEGYRYTYTERKMWSVEERFVIYTEKDFEQAFLNDQDFREYLSREGDIISLISEEFEQIIEDCTERIGVDKLPFFEFLKPEVYRKITIVFDFEAIKEFNENKKLWEVTKTDTSEEYESNYLDNFPYEGTHRDVDAVENLEEAFDLIKKSLSPFVKNQRFSKEERQYTMSRWFERQKDR